jgi:hypothetical protein
MTRKLIEADPLVGVKFFKLKLLSNLIKHTLQDNLHDKDFLQEISLLLQAFLHNQYRETLLE